MTRATFASLEGATPADWAIIADPLHARREADRLVENLFDLLQLQNSHETFGWPINGFRHCVQTASRALRAGEDEALVVAALFHDATEAIDLHAHGESAALLLEPYVGEANAWIIRHHALFQDYHCKTHPGRFTTDREQYRGHPYFERTVLFCERYDQASFDERYEDLALSMLEPIVRRVIVPC